MTTYDAAMAIVVVLGMARGAWRGFTWQMASITSLVLGYTAAHSMSGKVAAYLPGEPEVQRMAAMAVIYVAVSGGIFGIAWMIRGTLRKLKFEAYDRHLGTLLGGLEAVGVGMLATMFVVSVVPKTRQPIFSSPTGRVVGTVMNNLGPVLPVEIRKVLAPHWDGKFPTDEAVVEHDAGTSQHGAKGLAAAAEELASSLPAPDEAPSGTESELPALPALEAVPAHRAHRSADSSVLPALDGPSDGAESAASAVGGVLRQGRKQVEKAINDSIDQQLERLGGLEAAPPKGKQ